MAPFMAGLATAVQGHSQAHNVQSSEGQSSGTGTQGQLHTFKEPGQQQDTENKMPPSTEDVHSGPERTSDHEYDTDRPLNEPAVSIGQLPRHGRFNGPVEHLDDIMDTLSSRSKESRSSDIGSTTAAYRGGASTVTSARSASEHSASRTMIEATQDPSTSNHHHHLHIETVHHQYYGPGDIGLQVDTSPASAPVSVASAPLSAASAPSSVASAPIAVASVLNQPVKLPPKKRTTWYGVQVNAKDKAPSRTKPPRPLSFGFGYKEYANGVVVAKRASSTQSSAVSSPVIPSSALPLPQAGSPITANTSTPSTPAIHPSLNQDHSVPAAGTYHAQAMAKPRGHYLTHSTSTKKISMPKFLTANVPPNMGRSYDPPHPPVFALGIQPPTAGPQGFSSVQAGGAPPSDPASAGTSVPKRSTGDNKAEAKDDSQSIKSQTQTPPSGMVESSCSDPSSGCSILSARDQANVAVTLKKDPSKAVMLKALGSQGVDPSLYPEEQSSYPRGDEDPYENPPHPSRVVQDVEEIQLDPRKMRAHHDAHPSIMDKVRGTLNEFWTSISSKEEKEDEENETDAADNHATMPPMSPEYSSRRRSFPAMAVNSSAPTRAASIAAALRASSSHGSEDDSVIATDVDRETFDIIFARKFEPVSVLPPETSTLSEKSTATHPVHVSSHSPTILRSHSGESKGTKQDNGTGTDTGHHIVSSTAAALSAATAAVAAGVARTGTKLKQFVHHDDGKMAEDKPYIPSHSNKTVIVPIDSSGTKGASVASSFHDEEEADPITDPKEAMTLFHELPFSEDSAVASVASTMPRERVDLGRTYALATVTSDGDEEGEFSAPAAAAISSAAAAYNQRQPSLKNPVLALSEQDANKPTVPIVSRRLILSEDDVDKPTVPTVSHMLTLTEDDVHKPVPCHSAHPVLRLTEDDVGVPDPSSARHPVIPKVEPKDVPNSTLKIASAPRPMIPSQPAQGKDIKLSLPKMPEVHIPHMHMPHMYLPHMHLPKVKKPKMRKPKISKVKMPKFAKMPSVHMPTLTRKRKVGPVPVPEIRVVSAEPMASGCTKTNAPVVTDIADAPVVVATSLPVASRRAHVAENKAEVSQKLEEPSKELIGPVHLAVMAIDDAVAGPSTSLVLKTPTTAAVMAPNSPVGEEHTTALVVRTSTLPPTVKMVTSPCLEKVPPPLAVRSLTPLVNEAPCASLVVGTPPPTDRVSTLPVSMALSLVPVIEELSTLLVVRAPTPPPVVMTSNPQLAMEDSASSLDVKTPTPSSIANALAAFPVITEPILPVMKTSISLVVVPLAPVDMSALPLVSEDTSSSTAVTTLTPPSVEGALDPSTAQAPVRMPTPPPLIKTPTPPMDDAPITVPVTMLSIPPVIEAPTPQLAVRVSTPPIVQMSSITEEPISPMATRAPTSPPLPMAPVSIVKEPTPPPPVTRMPTPPQVVTPIPPVVKAPTPPPMPPSVVAPVPGSITTLEPAVVSVAAPTENRVIPPEGYDGPLPSVKKGETVVWLKKTRTTQYFYDSADRGEKELDELGFRKGKDVSLNLAPEPDSSSSSNHHRGHSMEGWEQRDKGKGRWFDKRVSAPLA
ncbi:MAG: hypothetical protein J3Q66DRAFT_404818 [Benniella sp.]|nr:MAG: hypothetical protein J3Q66DRAFT_404818 [Benniella sp.]